MMALRKDKASPLQAASARSRPAPRPATGLALKRLHIRLLPHSFRFLRSERRDWTMATWRGGAMNNEF